MTINALDLTASFFELFDLPVQFDIDLTDLASRYRQLQKVTHPDRFAGASDREQRLAVQYTAHVNEAYNTLKSATQRAIYLLSLEGVELNIENNTVMDPGFLMEQMEWREQLEEVKGASNPDEAIADLMAAVEAKSTQLQQRFVKAWQEQLPQSLKQAETIVKQMLFIDKLLVEAELLEAELDG
ncbi:Fe-S protein assembly co-chaperone HscB [Spartinivicinus poritis]|uniref:Co-chaperone protein HscB homolog n=1 Tax=Spartinivicinus poritis TaxID=2994640 RepID=A0ABT5U2B3_9GAMM|nr:Fe-S protein assembly co-chaperone HscB [Spartinivicinus sp. A2-2]MDE1460510.1 Fe-S protein assembly co-chaperone HscB [Spartinivicinus sp. A2-2]